LRKPESFPNTCAGYKSDAHTEQSLFATDQDKIGPAMPITLSVDRDRRVVYSALHGSISEAEFLRHQSTISSHPGFDPTYSEIVDFRGVTDVQVSPEAIQQLASMGSVFSLESQHIVIAPTGLIDKLARTYQGLAKESRPNLVIVKTPEEAYERLRGRG
jgi:hypothetical protein